MKTDRLFCQRVYQYREISVDQVHYGKEKQSRDHSYRFLIPRHIMRTLIVAVTKTAFDVGAGLIIFLRPGKISILLSALLRLRIIETWSVAETAHFLLAEKTEIESHSLFINSTYKNSYFSLLLQKHSAMDIRIGNGYDVHALAEGLPLWLGGVKIESPIGCIAHSDGDVAIHALCDALLGALAAGDIGKHFPDTSDEFKGIDSKILLSRVMTLIRTEGWKVGNVDVTIAMQRPKLAPYITEMRECMASVMGIDPAQVSVKATTTEKLGFVGRSEGCEVYAVALLTR